MADAAQLQRRLRLALQRSDYAEAADCLRRAAELAREAGDQAAAGRHLGNLALLHHRLRQPAQALACLEQALALVRTAGDRVAEDGLLGNMGNILRELGRHAEAVAHLNQALLLAQEMGDLRGRGIWLANLGLVYDDLGQHDRAADYHAQAVSVARQLFDQRGLAQRLGKLGDSRFAQADFVGAAAAYAEAAAISQAIGDRQGALERLASLGHARLQLGVSASSGEEASVHFRAAGDTYAQALALAAALDDAAAEAELLIGLGSALGNLGEYAAAAERFSAAAGLFERLGRPERLEAARQGRDLALALGRGR